MNSSQHCSFKTLPPVFFKKFQARIQAWKYCRGKGVTSMLTLQITAVCLLAAILWKVLPSCFVRSPTSLYGGFVHPDFQEVKDVFGKNIESGKEPGASFAVYHKGELLVDLWGGYADQEAGRLWKHNTLSQIWSCTKGIVAVIMATLVDRGLLDYSQYVHTYWPEFRQHGKENITVGMLLSHQSGLVSLGRQISLLEYRDNWNEIELLMLQATPAWEPGTRYCYHAYTYGMFADALVRKVDPNHRNISQFFKEEIAEPFGFDLYVGLPPELHYRVTRASYSSLWQIFTVAFISRPSRWKWVSQLFPGGIIYNSLMAVDIMKDMNAMNDPELQSIGLSSAVGFGTARSLAEFYDYLANGGSLNGKHLLTNSQVKALYTPVTQNITVIAVPDQQYAMGTAVDINPQGNLIFGHRGYGGQNAFAVPGYGIGVAYITNYNSMYSESDDPRAHDLLVALYKCLQQYKVTTMPRTI